MARETTAKLHSERVHELNGAMRFGELLFEFDFDLQVCAQRQGNRTNAIEAGVRAHQFSGGGLENGQGLLHIPTFADQAINSTNGSLCWVHGDASFFGATDRLQEARAGEWKPPPFQSEDRKRANE
jgi:hypothetical protein